MVMSAVDLVKHHEHGTDEQIRCGLDGNFCRCTGYQSIINAVHRAAEQRETVTSAEKFDLGSGGDCNTSQ
jgi:carbon-monoxide dehydrogenase small subunit